MNTTDKLDMLHGFRTQVEKAATEKADLISSLYTPEIREQVEAILAPIRLQEAEIEQEFLDRTAAAAGKISLLEKEIKEETLQAKETVKGKYLQCVFSKGATTWQTDKLEGYAVSNPDVLKFRNDPTPSCSFRVVAQPKEKK